MISSLGRGGLSGLTADISNTTNGDGIPNFSIVATTNFTCPSCNGLNDPNDDNDNDNGDGDGDGDDVTRIYYSILG